MNSIHEKMEKEVVSLIFRNYPDLRDQIKKARITGRKFTGCGFFTYYHNDDVSREEEMVISDVEGILNHNTEVGFVFFIREKSLTLECHMYGDEPFPDSIDSYALFIHEKQR